MNRFIRKTLVDKEILLSELEVDKIYDYLSQYSNMDESIKQDHIRNINN